MWAALIALGASTAGIVVWVSFGVCVIAYFSTHPLRNRKLKQTPARFDASYEDIKFPSRDNDVQLSGWFLPPRLCEAEAIARGIVVLCHGMLANRSEVLPWAEALWNGGFAVLMFDFRAVGESEGARCSAGYYEAMDLCGAVDYIDTRPDCNGLSLGVFGFSMGGATAIIAAADEQRIMAVAAHGAYASLDRALIQRCRRHFGPLASVAAWAIRAIGERWLPVPSSEVSPMNAVSQIAPRPLLLLHGRMDRVVHPSDAQDLHDAAGSPKTLNILPRSGHRSIHRSQRDDVREQVVEFFIENLRPSEPIASPVMAPLIPGMPGFTESVAGRLPEAAGVVGGATKPV
jgi:alpha-beta hydrolase superfamily lysophospholipase